MPTLTLLVGPPGSGKTSWARSFIRKDALHENEVVYVNQDLQGRAHLLRFEEAITANKDIVIDRLNFNKSQRDRYLVPAKEKGYKTKIIVLHESYKTCLDRCLARQDHETIKDEQSARSALGMFFSKYERVQDNEADQVIRSWPQEEKPLAVVIDLDGTLCNIDHRLHFVKTEGKKDWKGFFDNLLDDKPNQWCRDIVVAMHDMYQIVYASGRPDDHKKKTETWLEENDLDLHDGHLYMRARGDHRQDYITKEVILDFEILTRFTPLFFIDDRAQVVNLWRSRGFVCLACHEGDF